MGNIVMKKAENNKEKIYSGEGKESSKPKMAWIGKKKNTQLNYEPEESLVPDYEKYAQKSSWTIYEASALLAGISVAGLDKLHGRCLPSSKLLPDEVAWAIEADELSQRIYNEIKTDIGSEELEAKLVEGEYFIKTHILLKWVVKHSQIKIPDKLAELAHASGLFNKSSKTQGKAPPYDSDKTKLRYLKSDFISIAKKILTKNKNAVVSDVVKDHSYKLKRKKYKLPDNKPADKTYGGWMTIARRSFDPQIKGPLGKPQKSKQQ